jgi:hypothetical protein
VNAQGGTISSAQGSAQKYEIFTNDPAAFAINLHPAGGEVRYDLTYQYYFSGGNGGRFGGGRSGGGEQQENMARNVCAGLAP